MRIPLDSAMRLPGDNITSFDARSAYVKIFGLYVNVFTIVRGSRLSVKQSTTKQEALREKWKKFSTDNFLIEFRSFGCDNEGQRQMKLILAELEDREATDRLRTEDIDEFDFEARESVGALCQAYGSLILDSSFSWPGMEDNKLSFAAAHVSFKHMTKHLELQTVASLTAFNSGLSSATWVPLIQAMGIKTIDNSLALGAYIGLLISD